MTDSEINDRLYQLHSLAYRSPRKYRLALPEIRDLHYRRDVLNPRNAKTPATDR